MVRRITTLGVPSVVPAAAAVQRSVAGMAAACEEKHHGEESQDKPACRNPESRPEVIFNLDAVSEDPSTVEHIVSWTDGEIRNNTVAKRFYVVATECRGYICSVVKVRCTAASHAIRVLGGQQLRVFAHHRIADDIGYCTHQVHLTPARRCMPVPPLRADTKQKIT